MSNNELIQMETNPAAMIKYAIEKNASLEQIEKLLELKERFETNEARKAYHVAMASFKADPPKIKKDKKVGFNGAGGTRVGYSHASLGNVTEMINAGLSKHGLSASWVVTQTGDEIAVATKITHKLGHSEETVLKAKADNSGAKNAIQAIGSTVSYLERYGILALTGLATYDQDDDGVNAGIKFINEKQLNTLLDYIADKGVKLEKFLEYLKIENLEQLPETKYQQALVALQNKKK